MHLRLLLHYSHQARLQNLFSKNSLWYLQLISKSLQSRHHDVGAYTYITVIFLGFAAIVNKIILSEMYLKSYIESVSFFLTRKPTPFLFSFSWPLFNNVCPLSVVTSPVPIHRISASYLLSSSSFPYLARLLTFHLPIDVIFDVNLILLHFLSLFRTYSFM